MEKKALFNKIFSLWESLVLLLQQVLELEQLVEGVWVGWEQWQHPCVSVLGLLNLIMNVRL